MIWQYAILNFTKPDILADILSSFPVVVVFTVVATLNANVFYAWRIHKLSKRNWWLSGPIWMLFVTRTALGLYLAVKLTILKTWVATSPLKGTIVSSMAVSGATDIVISAARYYYLRDIKQGYMANQEMVDAVVIFTINDGVFTCAMLAATIACFLGMPNNFVWIALYGTVGKLYSNSVLATLNLRNWYRHRERPMGIRLTRPPPNRNTFQIDSGTAKMQSSDIHEMPTTMTVFMEQQIEYDVSTTK
jgi:hypothetical protein